MGTIGLKQLVIPPTGNGAESRRAVAQKDVDARKASVKSWKGHLAAMEVMSTDGKLVYLEQINRNKVEEAWQGSELRAMRLDLLLRSWINDPQRDAPSVQDKYTVKAMRLIVDLCARKVLTKAIAEKVKVVLSYTGVLLPDEGQLEDTKMTFKFVDLLEEKGKRPAFPSMHITEDPVEWQLRLWGEYMDRSIDATDDPRVGFRPDAWQRRVLDAIDRNSSLLVIAPTSSGKTFISYYAMEQVLRESDKGILVYIAPTKALAAQIAAEVYGRFKKTLPSGSLWAMQTRDYRIHDPLNCQILITVPEMLAIMLLSPPLAKSWTPRIKRIILDEIHSIGQQEGGAVWEQIVLLAPCPVIGLSATIGSPSKFNDWLASVQRAHGYEHELVEHPHRYSHLRKYQYVLAKKPPKFQGLSTYEPSQRIQFLHPAAMLANGPRAMPPDLAFEASDTLSLYKVLGKRADAIDIDINHLKPSTFFKSVKGLLSQKEVLAFEAALKQLLARLSSLALVSSDLKPPPLVANTVDSAFAPNADEFVQNLIHLVSDLHVTGSLPAIIFNFDRRYCEIIAQRLVSELERAKEAWRRSSPAWTTRIEQWEKWKAKAKDRQRQETRAKRNAGNEDELPEPSTDTHSLPWAFDALYRGIAVHHAGMNKHDRTLIERYENVRTLALGINAPAKTAYRQCAGRAGRREYDLYGNVVFYGLLEERIQRLALSKLPSLGGIFPMTSTILMSLPHVTFTASADRHQLLHHVRFSFEYLRQAGLLDAEGQPMNLYGVAAHLYYTEPSNFALVALLRQGILHDIAAQKSFEDAKREFIVLMCHLFDRRYLPRVCTQKPHLQALLRKYPSRVLLPPLRPDAVRALREHDGEILRVFKGYAVTYAQSRNAKLPKDVCLPLSHTSYAGSSESSPFKESLQRTTVPRSVRSSFIATSGHGDEFASVSSELCRTARAGVELHEHSIPSMERFICYANNDETDGVEHVLNAYIYDFYTHGQPTSLAQANGIKYGDIWYLLEDFNLVLLTLKTALQQLLSRTRSEDAEAVVGVDLDE
ncbi:hypothetical protein EV121DRAFT_266073, partial [Schizophyllum commune]